MDQNRSDILPQVEPNTEVGPQADAAMPESEGSPVAVLTAPSEPTVAIPDGTRTPWESVAPEELVDAPEDGQKPAIALDEQFPNGEDSRPVRGGGLLTIPLLCVGIVLIACSILLPQADANRALAYERMRLQRDLDHLKKQEQINDEFLKTIGQDPTLAERLAQRQMKMVREGTTILDLKGDGGKEDLSPFLLVDVPPPPALAPYQPSGGRLEQAFRNPRFRLYATGAGLLMIAAGLVLGASGSRASD